MSKEEAIDAGISSEDNHLTDYRHSEDTRRKLSETHIGCKNNQFGKHWYYDPETKINKPYFEGQQPDGWILGRYYSKE